MVNDHLSDLVTRIRNGYRAGKPEVGARSTKLNREFVRVLEEEEYIDGVEVEGEKLVITLKYEGRVGAILGIRRVSRPGARIYQPLRRLKRVWGRLGINILSTPGGVMSERRAKKLKLGGEILAQVW